MISIIIPAYNEERYIVSTLQSIRKQPYKKIEIIVVANRCTDNTAKKAKPLADKVITTNQKGQSKAKNLGAKNAKGEILLFLDADTHPSKKLLATIVTSVNKGYEGGKVGFKPLDDKRLSAKFLMWQSGIKNILLNPFKNLDGGNGGCTFMSRKLYNKLLNEKKQLFDENIHVAEDMLLTKRMKKQGKFQFIRKPCAYTSMRRFKEEGYLQPIINDILAVINPKGKTRKRWGKK